LKGSLFSLISPFYLRKASVLVKMELATMTAPTTRKVHI